MKAIWNNKVIAESDNTLQIEGMHYFPVSAVTKKLLEDSQTHTDCHWKGRASYYNVVIDGKVNKDAAWYYPDPSNAAENIRDHVAFWRGVEIVE